MSTTIIEGTEHSISVMYPDVTYFVGGLGSYFVQIGLAWRLCMDLSSGRYEMTSNFSLGGSARRSSWSLEESQQLRFARIQLNSPLDITLAIEAAGGTGITIYALHLLSAVLRDPERIGGWLPRLAAGWHNARREAELARLERKRQASVTNMHRRALDDDHRLRMQEAESINKQVDETVTELVDLSRHLEEFQPAQVIVNTDSGTPEDITRALKADH